MADVINVLVAFDTETIAKLPNPSQDPDNPTMLSSNAGNLIFMIVKQGNVISGQAGDELNISAQVNDIIRWRETSLSLNSDSSALIYRYKPISGGELISKNPTLEETHPVVPVPKSDEDDPTHTHPTVKKSDDFYRQSTVRDSGSVTYTFSFFIMDTHERIIGFYSWDPFITIQG